MKYQHYDLPDKGNIYYEMADKIIRQYISEMNKMGYLADAIEMKLHIMVRLAMYDEEMSTILD